MTLLLTLNIAGDSFDVLFDGDRVTSPEFPDQPLEYIAPCGTKITQPMLVQVCCAKTIALSLLSDCDVSAIPDKSISNALTHNLLN